MSEVVIQLVRFQWAAQGSLFGSIWVQDTESSKEKRKWEGEWNLEGSMALTIQIQNGLVCYIVVSIHMDWIMCVKWKSLHYQLIFLWLSSKVKYCSSRRIRIWTGDIKTAGWVIIRFARIGYIWLINIRWLLIKYWDPPFCSFSGLPRSAFEVNHFVESARVATNVSRRQLYKLHLRCFWQRKKIVS